MSVILLKTLYIFVHRPVLKLFTVIAKLLKAISLFQSQISSTTCSLKKPCVKIAETYINCHKKFDLTTNILQSGLAETSGIFSGSEIKHLNTSSSLCHCHYFASLLPFTLEGKMVTMCTVFQLG